MDHLVFSGRVSRASVEQLLTDLRAPNAPGRVLVSSPGGEFECFSTLGPALARRGLVTLSGDVRSAAVILYLLGHRRLALPDATFFFHEVRTLVDGGEITIADLEAVREYADRMSGERREALEEWHRQMRMAQAWFLDFIARRTGLPPGTFLNLMRAEATLTAREAVRYGIVHGVLPHLER